MIFRGFGPFRRRAPLTVGQRMILEHARWLTKALKRKNQLPRIPVRKVSEGGFVRLMATPSGRYRAERWWEKTLQHLDD